MARDGRKDKVRIAGLVQHTPHRPGAPEIAAGNPAVTGRTAADDVTDVEDDDTRDLAIGRRIMLRYRRVFDALARS